MIWLAWRMQRSAIITALGFFGILATFILVTGLMAHAEFTRLALAGCLDAHPTSACLQTGLAGVAYEHLKDRCSPLGADRLIGY